MSSAPVTLVSALASARKATQFYPREHPRYVDAIASLVTAASDCTIDGPFVLNLHKGRLYVGSDVITGDVPALTSMTEALENRLVESLTLQPGFDESDALGLTAVLNLRPSASLDVEAELARRQVRNVSVAKVVDENAEEKEERDRARERDRALYRRFVSTMRAVSARLEQGRDVDLAEAGGLVPEMMVRLSENQAAVLALATMRAQGEQDLFHTINVMIYALTIGAALELPQEGFASLGVCSLVHDIGKSAFPAEADPDDVRLLHPNAGADILSRLPAGDPAPMLVAYEHHMGVDGSGWPEHAHDYMPHPYSRMVAIADRYETLTKSPNGPQLTPDKAVGQLLRDANTFLDPVFTRIFVQALGVFPVGCMVRLSDHTVGVVSGKGSDPMRPHVRAVYDTVGIELDEPVDIDLAEDGRSIVEVVDERQLAVMVADKL
jgi:HD-GYP domain-containing protein (c-di-GMP phosphodiesterase class II)